MEGAEYVFSMYAGWSERTSRTRRIELLSNL
jgi:hypothetical protein